MASHPPSPPVSAFTSAVRRRTQAERRDQSSRALIEAALQVTARDGVKAATFDAIGREAGFSRGLATQKFGSKDGLIRALIADLHDRQTAYLEAAHIADMDGLSALITFVRLHAQAIGAGNANAAYYRLLASTVADATPERAAFAESHGVIRALMAALVRKGQASGHIRRDADAYAVAVMTGSALMGLNLQAMIDRSTDISAVTEALIAALGSLAVPEAPPP